MLSVHIIGKVGDGHIGGRELLTMYVIGNVRSRRTSTEYKRVVDYFYNRRSIIGGPVGEDILLTM